MENIDNEASSKPSLPRFWTRDSSFLLGGFFLVISLVVYFWWPLAAAVIRGINRDGQWWLHMDWLLLGIFAFTSLTIVARAHLKTDALLIFVGICGGLAIEAWGTQTNLWHYYTAERPPLWIIPAWPIANLSIDRITRTLDFFIKKITRERKIEGAFKAAYWIIFITFMILMISFIAPTFDKPYTILSLLLCAALTLTPTNYRRATLLFIAGTALGYALELWGTTNHCWTYYTRETPPLFAVLAHGLAAVAFWRAGLVLKMIGKTIMEKKKNTYNLFGRSLAIIQSLTNTMNSLIKAGFTPIGKRENGETFSLSPEERPGILQLFGQSGQGKTVTIQGIIISDIRNDRMGMFIDPWGDVIEEIQSLIPAEKADKVSVFEAQKVSLDENIKKFRHEIADSIKKGGFLLCRLDYRTLGEDAVKALGSQMVKIFLQIIGTKESSLIIDEAHNFIDEETMGIIIKNKIEKMSCILADQAPVHYQKDVLGRLFESTNHVLSYLIDKDSANLIAKYHPEIEPEKLTALEKYNFMAKINAKTASPVTMKMRGIFPILV